MPAELDAPKELRLPPGGSRTVHASGHGIGGYLWTAEAVSGGARVEERVSPPSPDAIGGGAGIAFRITAPGSGSSVLRFRYARPWEGEAEQTHRVTVRVGE